MPTLIAIDYQNETTAAAAGEEVVRLSTRLEVSPEAVARPRFACEVRELPAPRTSALFLLVDERGADLVLDALGRYGGDVRRLDRARPGEIDRSGP